MHFSIIIPSYNSEKTINRCLDSVLKQTFQDYECIVIDDGSTDNSPKILDEYACLDSRFKIIHKKNNGVSSARNHGIEYARGQYVVFIDSDDYVSEKYLEHFNLCSDDLIISGVNIINEIEISKIEVPHQFKLYNDISDIMNDCINATFLRAPWSKAFKKSLLLEYIIQFNPNIHFAEDYIFNLTFLKYAKSVSLIPYSDYYYFAPPENKIYKFNTYEYIFTVKEYLNIIKSLSIEDCILSKEIQINKTLLYSKYYQYCSSLKSKDFFSNFFNFLIQKGWKYTHHKGVLGKYKSIIEIFKILFK